MFRLPLAIFCKPSPHRRHARPGAVATAALVTAAFAMPPLASTLSPSAVAQQISPALQRQAEAAFAAAAELQNGGQFDIAAEDWEKFLQRFAASPLATKARYYAGVCRTQLNDFSAAESHFRQLLRQSPDFELAENAYLSLGWCQYSLGSGGEPKMYDRALATLKQLASRFPNSGHLDQAHFYAGEIYYARGDRRQAIAHYARLVNRHRDSPLYASALYALGVTYEEQEQFPQAGRVYDRFLADCAGHELTTEIRMRKAETILQNGSAAEAEALFAAVAAVAGFGAADHALWRQAYCAVKQSDDLRAGQLYEKLLSNFPSSEYHEDAAIAAARCYYRAQRYEAASVWLRRIAQTPGPNQTEAAHWLAQIHLAQGNAGRAFQIADRTLGGNPRDRYTTILQLDRIDARAVAEPRAAAADYIAFAAANRQHELAPQALYNAAFTWMELEEFAEAAAASSTFQQQFRSHALLVDVRQIAAEAALQLKRYDEAEQQYVDLLTGQANHADESAWRIRLGLTYYLQQKYAEAIAALESHLSELNDPAEIAEAQYVLGMSHFGLEQYQRAGRHLRASLIAKSDGQHSDEVWLHFSRVQQKLGSSEDAIASLRQLPERFPDSKLLDQAEYYLAEYAFEAGSFDVARAAYGRLVERFPESNLLPHALYGMGWAGLKLADWKSAEAAFTRLLADFPDHSTALDARLGRGMVRRRMNRFQDSLADIDSYLKSAPGGGRRADALFERGLAAAGMEDFTAAAASFEQVLAAAPAGDRQAQVLYELGWTLKKSGDSGSAAAAFRQLIEAAPQHPLAAEAYFHLGEEQYASEQYQAALTAFQKSAAAAADNAGISEQALHKAAWSYYRLDRFPQAATAFEAQLERHPEGELAADGQFMLAECLFQEQDFRAALPAFLSAARRPPASASMQVLLLLHGGQAAGALQQWDASLRLLDRIPREFSESAYLAEALFERGRAQRELNDAAAAIADFERAASLSRSEVGARARFMVGEAHFERKDFENAIAHYRRVIYGYGGESAPAAVKAWQAFAAYEAGRCQEVLAQKAGSARQRTEHLDAAVQFYRLMINRDPQHELAGHAQQRLAELAGGGP